MRYIGNKTRLLPFILRTLGRSGINVGSAHDAFAGTASVSRALKAEGWRVHSSDLLMSSYVFQRAYVVADYEKFHRRTSYRVPHFDKAVGVIVDRQDRQAVEIRQHVFAATTDIRRRMHTPRPPFLPPSSDGRFSDSIGERERGGGPNAFRAPPARS